MFFFLCVPHLYLHKGCVRIYKRWQGEGNFLDIQPEVKCFISLVSVLYLKPLEIWDGQPYLVNHSNSSVSNGCQHLSGAAACVAGLVV